MVKNVEVYPCSVVEYVFRAENNAFTELFGLTVPVEYLPPIDRELRPYLESKQLQIWELDEGLTLGEDGVIRPNSTLKAPAGEPLDLGFSVRILDENCQPLVSPWEREHPNSQWVVWPNLLDGGSLGGGGGGQQRLAGDANGDGSVDELDYAIWHASYGKSTEGDFNNDGRTDELDYAIWWRNFEN